ncbi:ABC transporter permease subunit [Blautia sp. LMAG:75]|uniref:ABC transporter permease subunit n=1 Tax=Blautia sp. LMAG:75 TaxID=1969171 RepID=UPI0025B8C980|nr:ABC transporter permease subunit [Blautia sp. LMAG:75]
MVDAVGSGYLESVGWNGIIYIAAIAGIDAELYEAARVDGANRFQLIKNITIPSLYPTFFVLLLLSISNLLNNGLTSICILQPIGCRQDRGS